MFLDVNVCIATLVGDCVATLRDCTNYKIPARYIIRKYGSTFYIGIAMVILPYFVIYNIIYIYICIGMLQ